MRLLSLDFDPIFGEHSTRSSFTGEISAFDYDVVLWDPATTFAEAVQYAAKFNGLPALSDTDSASLKAAVERRASEFDAFLKAGRTLVIVLRPPQVCYVATGEVTWSGTGKNARSTRIVDSLDLLDAVPVKLGTPSLASGDRIEVHGDGPISSFLRKYLADLQYNAVLENPEGSVLARVRGTNRAVAVQGSVEGGGLLLAIPASKFVPQIEDEDDPDGKEHWPDRSADFQVDLLAAIQSQVGQSEVIRPAWATNFTTGAEKLAQEKVSKQSASVDRARKALAKAQEELAKVEALSQLYLGTGRTLELQVRDVFKMIGGTVSEPEPNRADWHVDFSGTPAVLEIKGVTKSASEKNAAQLEKWVAGVYESTGTSPKGLLVVNTWREVPLPDRTEADFPDQMLPYSIARGHCLLTGLDVFAIACDIQRDRDRSHFWRDKILSTSGRLEGAPDWREFIQESGTSDEAKGGRAE